MLQNFSAFLFMSTAGWRRRRSFLYQEDIISCKDRSCCFRCPGIPEEPRLSSAYFNNLYFFRHTGSFQRTAFKIVKDFSCNDQIISFVPGNIDQIAHGHIHDIGQLHNFFEYAFLFQFLTQKLCCDSSFPLGIGGGVEGKNTYPRGTVVIGTGDRKNPFRQTYRRKD